MKDVRYYKEGARNYMVLSCSGKEAKSYQQKMMERRSLPHIFSCKIKYINGESFYYYDITSKVNMQNLHRGKQWNLPMIKKVLSDYEAALQELDSFLLEQDKLILDPEYIYYDYGSDRYIFLFYPENQSEENIYEKLFDFWVEHLDNQDEPTVECIYKLYEEAENCCLGMDRVKELLNCYDVPSPVQEQGNHEMTDVSAEDVMRGIQNPMLSVYEPVQTDRAAGIQEERNMKNGPGVVFYSVFLILVMLGEAGVGAVYLLFKCSEQEKLVLLAAAVVMGCLLICICKLLIRERGAQKRKEQYDQTLTESRENDYGSVMQPAMSEPVQMKEFLSVGRSAYTKDGHGAGCAGDADAAADDEPVGETVFFAAESERENKLYALDRKNKQHISLDTLPVTIGKLKGAVDVCISDTSVSRVHAQIEADGNTFYIKDLNSTNGTFLNGLRLNPNDRRELEPGDEVRFGKLRYMLR